MNRTISVERENLASLLRGIALQVESGEGALTIAEKISGAVDAAREIEYSESDTKGPNPSGGHVIEESPIG